MGKVAPESAKPFPETFMELTTRAAVPDEVSVSVLVAPVFTFTLPKLMELALSVRVEVAAGVPVPLRAITSVLPPELLLYTVIVPLAPPAAVGLKLNLSVRD